MSDKNPVDPLILDPAVWIKSIQKTDKGVIDLQWRDIEEGEEHRALITVDINESGIVCSGEVEDDTGVVKPKLSEFVKESIAERDAQSTLKQQLDAIIKDYGFIATALYLFGRASPEERAQFEGMAKAVVNTLVDHPAAKQGVPAPFGWLQAKLENTSVPRAAVVKANSLKINKKKKKLSIPLPPLPEGLSWPPQYESTRFFGKKDGIVKYLNENWKDLIAAGGIVTMPLLRHHYEKTAIAIDEYLTPRRNRKPHVFPADLVVPTIMDVTDQARMQTRKPRSNPEP